MSIVNGIITAPISIEDVKQALGESSNDLATLCKSSKINMWSRHKPVIHTSLFDENAIKANDGNFGFNIPKFTSLTELFANYQKYENEDGLHRGDDGYRIPTNGITYMQPTGGNTSPYRISDFKNYSNKVTCLPYQFDISVYTQEELTFTIYQDKNVNDTGICVEDIALYNNCYFGVCFFNYDSGKIHSYITSNNKTDLYLRTSFANQNLVKTTYIAIPFMSPTRYLNNAPNLDTNDNIICYPIIGVSTTRFVGKSESTDPSKFIYFIYPDQDTSGNECIRIYNKSVVLTTGYILYLLYEDSEYYIGYSLKSGEHQISSGTLNTNSNIVVYLDKSLLVIGKNYKLTLISTNNNKVAQELYL